jgi:CrcB protein
VENARANEGDLQEQDAPLARVSALEVLVVGVGGAFGVGVRYAVTQNAHLAVLGRGDAAIISSLFCINIAGAFLLGLVLPLLRGDQRHLWRLTLTTGVLGGFTSYGALADITRRQIVQHASSGLVLGHLAASLLGGLAAVYLGHLAGERFARVSA